MYKNRRIVLLSCAWNEEGKIETMLGRLPWDMAEEVVVVDDGSTDRTADICREAGATVISLDRVYGVGYALREGLRYCREQGHEIAVTVAGNNKDEPKEIPQLLDPICDEGYDFVMGSRFLAGGGYGGDMPFYRKLATRMHPWLISRFTGTRITESTNGFRAMRLGVLDDPRIDLDQSWLDHYELEVYLLMKLLKLDEFRTTEVPATKIYPKKQLGRTKMKPVTDWWRMLRPVVLLGTGLRK